MPIHSFFILTPQAKVLFSKYYHPHLRPTSKAQERQEWEALLYRNIKQTLTEEAGAVVNTPQFFVEGEVCVVYQGFQDVVVLLAGGEECDEMILIDLLKVVQEVLLLACKKKKIASVSVEAALLTGDAYGKFSTLVDQMMPQGQVEHTNMELLDRLAKAKPVA